jgi:hypothetical protein
MSKVSPAKTGGAMARSPSHKWNTLFNILSPLRVNIGPLQLQAKGVNEKYPGIGPSDKERGK